jgi:hypothetical protein
LAKASDLSTANTNISAIKTVTDLLTTAQIATAVWNNSSRTLTSATGGGGATAQEVWEYASRTLTAIPSGTALASQISALNNISTSQVLAQVSAGLTNYGVPTLTNLNNSVSALATASNLATANSNINSIKNITDQLTLANINAQCDLAISDASLYESIALANNNITLIKNTTDLLTLAQIATSVWNNNSRTLTSGGGTGGGATAQEVWEYASRTLTAIPSGTALASQISALNNLSQSQVSSSVVTGLSNYGTATVTNLNNAVSTLATASGLNSVGSNVSAIKTITDNLTLANINAQCDLAISDASIPGSLSLANSNIFAIKAITDLLTLSAIASSVWANSTRTLTSAAGEGGATAEEVWNYSTRALTAIPTGTALASDLSTANNNISAIKSKTDLLTLAAIASQVWTNASRTLTSAAEGGGATVEEIWGHTSRTLTAVPTGTALTSDLTGLATSEDITEIINSDLYKLLNIFLTGNLTKQATEDGYTITLADSDDESKYIQFSEDEDGNRTKITIQL